MLFHCVVDRGVNKRRRNDNRREYPLSSLLECYQCVRHDEHTCYGNSGVPVPPFGCTFSTAPGQHNTLAVANEEGTVSIYNTAEKQNPVLKEWLAHDNAVFDIAWVPGLNSLVTASGDQTARLWDVHAGELLGSFRGHQCSLKSVAFPKHEKAVFCTGGRDGNIMVWDTRCSKKDGFYRQVKQISGAHMKTERHTPQTKKRRPPSRGMAPSVDSQRGVTVVLFSDENTLVSSGAVDGTIKMWDLRKSYTAYHQNPSALRTYEYPGSSSRKLGYSGLALDSTGSRLFCNCTDDNVYMFDISGLKATPVAVFRGHRNASFYVKSSISPDDQFLASGSSDGHAYIWKISEPAQAPVMLQGHDQEVTSVSWCPTDFTKIATCSDDNTVRIWRLNRGTDGEKSSVGEANLVGWTFRKIQTPPRPAGPFPHVELTPARSSRAGSVDSLASPQPGACAPSGADLPHPSSTIAAAAKLSPPHPKTPRSIRQWLACSDQATSTLLKDTASLRKVLSPCSQSSEHNSSSERRAKRRLETGEEGSTAHSGLGNEDEGVTELYPDTKRRQSSTGTFCPLTEGETSQGFQHWEERPASSVQADKENSSPSKADWLSAMGRRLKQAHRGSALSKSPSSRKRQEARSQYSSMLSSLHSVRKMNSSQAQKVTSPHSMKKISSYFHKMLQE
ncbi:denticleless protein homolog [Electrophorus electricus]|uniref:denticleless protein homolog n=1 Tax=Electrophorus electricus TaxID=8005 RepID=UPI0015CFAB89|nr:denticleless protein homolog [Electrophorus electricus]